jgi:hypothetical protein
MKRPRPLTGASSRGRTSGPATGDQLLPADSRALNSELPAAASLGVRGDRRLRGFTLTVDTLAPQIALNGVEGDLKWEYRKPRLADDGGASKDQERRHLNSPQSGVATRIGRDGRHPLRGVRSVVFFWGGLMWALCATLSGQ